MMPYIKLSSGILVFWHIPTIGGILNTSGVFKWFEFDEDSASGLNDVRPKAHLQTYKNISLW